MYIDPGVRAFKRLYKRYYSQGNNSTLPEQHKENYMHQQTTHASKIKAKRTIKKNFKSYRICW